MTTFNIPKIQIGELELALIQVGMGVGISMANLASAVANGGGLGVIASVGLGDPLEYSREYIQRSNTALRDEIRLARSKTSGAIGVNIMHALTNYPELVKTCLEENVDVIISGAGVPRDLPLLAKALGNIHTKLIPIVSSAELAGFMCKAWQRYNHLPDAIVVEGPKAGGHLGYSYEQLTDSEFVSHGLEQIIPKVIAAVKPYETKRKIPVIAAGGIYYGGDIKKFLELGAAGVQMATRFVITYECDAPQEFKQAYLDCKREDIVIIKSPVGMPGRAIKSKFLEQVEAGAKIPVNCPYHCLKPCVPRDSPYCIARALVDAKKGNLEKGFVFCGSNAWRCKEIVSVAQVFQDLGREYLEGKVSD
jgi:nitronate monooxygenase